MKAEFSEFSYGFAVTSELSDSLGEDLIAAPVFPTLRDEWRLGWDVSLRMAGISLFLQFKLAELLTRRTAGEWGLYNAPYYRFQLHRAARCRQHNLLKGLAEVNSHVYYVAPRFTRVPEFDLRYRRRRVVPESAWISLLRLPWVNDAYPHHVTYRSGRDLRFSSPESEPLEGDITGDAWIADVRRAWETEHRIIDRAYFGEMHTTLLRVLMDPRWASGWHVDWPASQESEDLFREITYLCRTFFGVEMVLVGKRISQRR